MRRHAASAKRSGPCREKPLKTSLLLTPRARPDVLLDLRGIDYFAGAGRAGAARAILQGVFLQIARGQIVTLIGPNGAGKTTFINLLTGVFPPSAGDVFLGDENITSLPQYVRVKRGMTRTFQINTLFPGLTVFESVVLAICEREGRAAVAHRTVAARGGE